METGESKRPEEATTKGGPVRSEGGDGGNGKGECKTGGGEHQKQREKRRIAAILSAGEEVIISRR